MKSFVRGVLVAILILLHSPLGNGSGSAAEEIAGVSILEELKTETRFAVVVAHGVRCPVMRQNYPAFLRLIEEYEGRGVDFLFVNGVPQDSTTDIETERTKYGIPHVKRDESQNILRGLGLKTVGETVLLERRDGKWMVRYRGGISDRVNFDRALSKAPNEFLKNALTDALANKEVRGKRGTVFGCSISFR